MLRPGEMMMVAHRATIQLVSREEARESWQWRRRLLVFELLLLSACLADLYRLPAQVSRHAPDVVNSGVHHALCDSLLIRHFRDEALLHGRFLLKVSIFLPNMLLF